MSAYWTNTFQSALTLCRSALCPKCSEADCDCCGGGENPEFLQGKQVQHDSRPFYDNANHSLGIHLLLLLSCRTTGTTQRALGYDTLC